MKKYKNKIDEAIQKNNILWSQHSDEERFNDNLKRDEILNSILEGVIIEEYPNDKPLPSCLIYGKFNNRNIHTCIAYNEASGNVRIITVYIPSLERWLPDFETRRPKNE